MGETGETVAPVELPWAPSILRPLELTLPPNTGSAVDSTGEESEERGNEEAEI